jgi:hypothetical protein
MNWYMPLCTLLYQIFSATISATVLKKSTGTFLVFIYITNMAEERLSATLIPAYSNNGLEN